MQDESVDRYLRRVKQLRRQSEATPELSLREPLLELIRAYGSEAGRSHLLVAPEASAGTVGQPDIFVKDGPRLIGFVETKAPSAALLALLRSSDQLRRYNESLPNWVLTDYYNFVFIRYGESGPSLDIREEPETIRAEFEKFFDNVPRNIRSASRLADEMARRARLLRDGLYGALNAEGPAGDLRITLDFYRRNLMDDLSELDFADTFAQTVVYGMFLGWLRWAEAREPVGKRGRRPFGSGQVFTRHMAAAEIPTSVPFLRASMRLLTSDEILPRSVASLLDDLAALFDNTVSRPIREETAAIGLTRGSDLTIYFYERFLERYDAGERKKRGVYYTPPELVEYVVRAVQQLLVNEFERPAGLADSSVVLLDPAVGTGTFLLGAAEQALSVVASQGTAAQRRLLREHLLQNFYGFELLPAPYAVAHLKVGSFFDQRGYKFTERDRAHIYLTNTLHGEENEAGQLELLPIFSGITDEAVAAGRVKRDVPVLVVLGNPPYDRTSHNSNPFSDRLQEDFYKVDGQRLRDRNSAPLKDDYLRFIRWAVWKLLDQEQAPGHGILAFVTNRAYIERTLHRGVRKFLLEKFDEIWVYDLHGDQREWFRDRIDEKVFKEVQAGIVVAILVNRSGAKSRDPARVHYREAWGTRDSKLEQVKSARVGGKEWTRLRPKGPLWLMVPYDVPEPYDNWPTVAQLFPVNVIGVQTHRDQLVVADTEQELGERLARFADPNVPDAEWEKEGTKSTSDGWNLSHQRTALRAKGARNIRQWTYRGLERRWIAFDERLIDRPRTSVSTHLLDDDANIALAFSNGSLPDGPYAVLSRGPVPAAVLSWRTFGAAYMAPLWLHSEVSDSRIPNLPGNLLDRLARLGIGATPEQLLHYVYAILNSRTYRDMYADGLRYGFARVPITSDQQSFSQLVRHGSQLASIHLLEHSELSARAPAMDGDDQAIIDRPVYDGPTETLWLAGNLRSTPISVESWTYQHGSYLVLRDFLERRQGRMLTSNEFHEFRLLSAAVEMTLELLPKVDAAMRAVVETGSVLTAEELRLAQVIGEE